MRFSAPGALLFLTYLSSILVGQPGPLLRVVDAEYSATLNRIVMISAAQNQLHIYDPEARVDTTVALPLAPLSLSVSPNGLYAAVGFDALVAHVNLTNGTVEKLWPVAGVVGEVIAANDYVHIDMGRYQVRSIAIGTGQLSAALPYLEQRLKGGRLHPTRGRIYVTRDGTSPNDLEYVDVSTGPVTGGGDSNYHGEFQICGGVLLSADGTRAYNACGSVMTLSTTPALDMRYLNVLPGVYTGRFAEPPVQAMAESGVSGRLAVMGTWTGAYNPTEILEDNEIRVYDTAMLAPNARLRLTPFTMNGVQFAVHGRWLFFDSTGQKLHVVKEAAVTSLAFSVETIDLGSAVPCLSTAAPASLTVPWTGTSGTIALTASGGCVSATSTDAGWLQVADYRLVAGTVTIPYHVRANATGSVRTGTIRVGGLSIPVTQDAAPATRPMKVPFSYKVNDVEYSRTLGRLVAVATLPNELHLVNPLTGEDQSVALAREPLSVSVAPDGLTAAVGHDGFLSVVSLTTLQVTKLLPVGFDAADVVLAGNGYVYAWPLRWLSDVYSVELATGTQTVDRTFDTGRKARLHPGGTFLYTGGGGNSGVTKWSVAGGALRVVAGASSRLCDDSWYSQDGGRLFTGCGTALRSSTNPAEDLAYNGSLGSVLGISWADQAPALATTAALTVPISSERALTLFGDEFLGQSTSTPLGRVTVSGSSYEVQGKQVFFGLGGSALYVVTAVDPAAPVVNGHSLTVYRQNIGSNGCTLQLNGAPGTLSAAAGFGALGVVSGSDCVWGATSSASWLRISAGGLGIGTGQILWTTEANPTGLARTAMIQVSGEIVMVTQAGGAPVAVPMVVGVSPANATAAVQPLTFTVSDGDGTANLARVYFHIGADRTVAPNGCHGFYDRASNTMFLYNDGLTVPQGPVTPGVAGTVENGQCRLSGAASSVRPVTATELAVTFGLEVKGSYLTGLRTVYLWVTDAQQNGMGWVQTGSWTMPSLVNRAPTVVALNVSIIGVSQEVLLWARDADGGDDVTRVYFLVNATDTVTQGSCHGFYDRAANSVFLYNDALTVLQGPLTLGVPGTLQNSQCSIDGARSSGAGASASTDMVARLAVRMQGGFATGARGLYLWAVDKQGGGSGGVSLGGWIAEMAFRTPSVVSGFPAESTAVTERFTFLARDGDGFANLSRVYFLVNQTIGIPANTCHGFYERANNSFYLYSDGLTTLNGPIVAGTAGVLQNSQCALNVGSSSVSGSGTDLTLAMAMTARGSYVGTAQRVALWAVDAQGNGTDWVQTGTWSAGVGAGPAAPAVVSWTPAALSNVNGLFTVLARDANGYADIDRVYFVLNSTPKVEVAGCHGFYDRATNAVYLYDAGLTGLLGPLAPNSAGSLSNGFCEVKGTGLTVTGDGNDLTISLPMQLKNAIFITGTRNLFFWAVDRGNLGTGWVGGPSWNGMNTSGPVVLPVQGVVASGATQTFSVTVSAASLEKIYFLVNPTPNIPTNGCHGYYERASGFVGLYNDALTATSLNAVSPSSVVPLANSQCSVNLAASSVSTNGMNTTLNLVLTRTGEFANGQQTVYWWAVDSNRLGTGWWPTAVWRP